MSHQTQASASPPSRKIFASATHCILLCSSSIACSLHSLSLILHSFVFMAPLQMKITRKPAILVAPLLPTPKGLLYLSNLDDQPSLRFHIPALQYYRFDPSKKGEDPAKVIREALAKVLVFYHPLAGRLREAPFGKLLVDCTSEGVLFVEADADVSMEEFGDLHPPFPCLDDLLHDVPFPWRNSETCTHLSPGWMICCMTCRALLCTIVHLLPLH